MPAYDAASTIDSAIGSVLAQTSGDFELIVADDGSTDGTVDAVRAYGADGRVRLVDCPHRGPAAARNAAIAVARGRYLSLLDSDDLYMPEYLEVMGATLDRAPDAGFAYTDAWLFDDLSRRFGRSTAMAPASPPDPPPADAWTFFQELLQRNFVYVAVTMRRAAADAVGGFNEHLRGPEDYDLWLRLLGHGYPAVRAPGLLAVYRQRFDSLSRDPLKMWEAALRVYRDLADDARLPEPARAAARARLGAAEREHTEYVRWWTARRPYLGLRPHLGRIKRALLERGDWLGSPPAEVASAFPDLTAR